MSTRLDVHGFKELLNSGVTPDKDIVVCHAIASQAKEDSYGGESERVLTFTISTGDVDREGDTIAPDGWRLDNFNRGGSVLWSHLRSEPPIGRPLRTWVDGDALKSTAQFTSRDENPFGYMIYGLAKAGYSRSASVGFRALKYAENRERGGWYPTDFLEQELTEWSVVNVPANPNALQEARSLGVDVAPMQLWASRLLDAKSELDPGTGLSKQYLESVYAATKSQHVTTVNLAANKATSGCGVGSQNADDQSGSEPIDCDHATNTISELDALRAKAKEARDAESKLSNAIKERIGGLVTELETMLGEYAESEGTDAADALVQPLAKHFPQQSGLPLNKETLRIIINETAKAIRSK